MPQAKHSVLPAHNAIQATATDKKALQALKCL